MSVNNGHHVDKTAKTAQALLPESTSCIDIDI